MEQLTVISGSGECFELSLPEGELLPYAAQLCSKAKEIPPEELRQEIIRCFRSCFPPRYQESLERISDADAFKLASASALLAGGDEAGAFSGEYPADRERENDITDEIILAAYHYKWRLDYAASLPPELLRRCLETAGARRALPSDIPEEIYTPEAVRKAAERAAEAVANYRKGN